MKKFEVKLMSTDYFIYEVVAEDIDEAEEQAFALCAEGDLGIHEEGEIVHCASIEVK